MGKDYNCTSWSWDDLQKLQYIWMKYECSCLNFVTNNASWAFKILLFPAGNGQYSEMKFGLFIGWLSGLLYDNFKHGFKSITAKGKKLDKNVFALIY